MSTDVVLEPGGTRVRRDIVHHTGSVVILAVDLSRRPARVLLERQYRHAANSYLWELPAGRIDPGEKALPAAQRELHEETGYTASNWRRILYFYASPGFVAETMSVYLATGLRAGKAQPEDDEKILKRMTPLPSALRMVLSGKIRDAKTIASILWLDHQVANKRRLSSSPENIAIVSEDVSQRSSFPTQLNQKLAGSLVSNLDYPILIARKCILVAGTSLGPRFRRAEKGG